jgi:hypothetical protein
LARVKVSRPALEVSEQRLASGPNFLARCRIEFMADNLHSERVNIAARHGGPEAGGLDQRRSPACERIVHP